MTCLKPRVLVPTSNCPPLAAPLSLPQPPYTLRPHACAPVLVPIVRNQPIGSSRIHENQLCFNSPPPSPVPKVAAYCDGRRAVAPHDALLLQHVLWDDPDTAHMIGRCVGIW